LSNVFGVEATTRLLFYKLEEEDYGIIKPFLIFLNFLPEIVFGINGKDIITSDIVLDEKVIKKLREIR